jgi:hypothetical protein
MYLGLLLIVLAVLFVFVGIFSGGVFTIVLVPLAVIAVLGALATLGAARAMGIEGTHIRPPGRQPRGRAPRGAGPEPGETPATPDDYVEARRRSQ